MNSNELRNRVFCGGGWDYDVPFWVRVLARGILEPTDRRDELGFRCVLIVRRARS